MKTYCCETMQFAVEDWGGVEYDRDTYWMIERDDSGWKKIDKCPWCLSVLKPPEESEEE